MKLLQLAVVLLLTLTIADVGLAKKKEKEPDIDLVTWAEQEKNRLPAEIDGVKIFRPNEMDKDGVIRITGIADMPGISATQGFIAAFISINDIIDRNSDVIEAVDYEKKRFVVSFETHNGTGNNATVYRYVAAFQFADNLMTFVIYDINIEYKEKGILPRKLDIEKLKPAKNKRHAELTEAFSQHISKIINNAMNYAINNPNLEVKHWPEIKKGIVVKGMNEAEVRLIGGSPRSINNTGERVQWMYSNDFIVIFTNGMVSAVIQ